MESPDTAVQTSNQELTTLLSHIKATVEDYMPGFVHFIPDVAAISADTSGITADAVAIAYALYADPGRFNYVHFEDIYIAQYRGYRNPMLWRLFTIWAYIMTVTCRADNDPEHKILLFECAAEARNTGDTVISGYIKAHAMYNIYYEYTTGEMADIFTILEPGIAAGHQLSILLKARILCNEEEYHTALPYLLMMAEMRYRPGVRLFIREYIHNAERGSHYRFLGELKTRTYDSRLLEYLAAPPDDVARFLKSKAVAGMPASATCPICLADGRELIYHDCREPTHALCVTCYCKTSRQCPTCRFNFLETRDRLVKCAHS